MGSAGALMPTAYSLWLQSAFSGDFEGHRVGGTQKHHILPLTKQHADGKAPALLRRASATPARVSLSAQ